MRLCAGDAQHFNSQPREGGWSAEVHTKIRTKHFNSQPREGGWHKPPQNLEKAYQFQLTAARRRLDVTRCNITITVKFQLTAARRRLGFSCGLRSLPRHFNSQPREGGWPPRAVILFPAHPFQLTAARRRLVPPLKPLTRKACIALFR